MKKLVTHLPVIVVGALATAALLRSPSAPAPQAVELAPLPADGAHPSSLSAGQLAHNGQDTRLVSCGDSRRARVIGNDTRGEVITGGSDRCTLLFAAPWPEPPRCKITGGELERAYSGELVIRGSHFRYDCGPGGGKR